jgi:copper chaperone CopZ
MTSAVRLDLYIPALQCEGHLDAVRSIVETLGASFVEADLDTRRVVVLLDGAAGREALETALGEFGYPPEPPDAR